MKVEYLTIGKIAKPQGVRGEVIVNIETDFPSRFYDTFFFLIQRKPGSPQEMEAEYVRDHKERIVIKFKGIDSRESAELLRNSDIVISAEERMLKDDDDYFYHYELEGLDVVDTNGKSLGTVQEVISVAGGNDVLSVTQEGQKDILIPFIKKYCEKVDIKNNTMVVNIPDNLKTINLKTSDK